MEEARITYCFIGKMKSITGLLEYNKLKRTNTLLEAKQMFTRCCEYNSLAPNETSVVKSKDGCFYLCTYLPDVFIQLFGENSLKEEEAFYAIERIKSIIDEDNDVGGYMEFEIKKAIFTFLDDFNSKLSDNNENDIAIEMRNSNEANTSIGMGKGRIMPFGSIDNSNVNGSHPMSLHRNSSNNQPTNFVNQRYANSPYAEESQPIQLQHPQPFQTLVQQAKTAFQPTQTSFHRSKSLDSFNGNIQMNQAIVSQNNKPLQANLANDNRNMSNSPILFKNLIDSKQLVNNANANRMPLQEVNEKPTARTPASPLIYNPYSLQHQPQHLQGGEGDGPFCKWIILAVLIAVILAAVIAIPVIMAYSIPL